MDRKQIDETVLYLQQRTDGLKQRLCAILQEEFERYTQDTGMSVRDINVRMLTLNRVGGDTEKVVESVDLDISPISMDD